MAGDAFFGQSRPFTKRKREDAPAGARSGASSSRRGVPSSSRGRGAPRGRGGSSNSRGRGRGGAAGGRGGAAGGSKRKEREDEELDEPNTNGGGGFDSDSVASGEDEIESESEEEDETETPAQKRLRLSQMYLKTLEKETLEDETAFDAADLDRDLIAERLQQDVLQHTGKLHVHVAESLQLPIPSSSIHTTPSSGHRGPVTSAVASEDGHWLYTGSKDGSIIKWDMSALLSPSPSASTSTAPAQPPRISKAVYFPKRISESAKRKEEVALKAAAASAKGKGKGKGKEGKEDSEAGHTSEVLCLALNAEGNILASGGRDKTLGVWDVSGSEGRWTRGLGGHKDAVASVTFRLGTTQLYSSSFDRTVKVFDLATLSYVETLFGHQDSIQFVHALRAELAVTAGGRDKTIRFWKVTEESQLVFRGGVASRIRNVLDGGNEEDGMEEDQQPNGRKRRTKGEIKYVEGSVDCVAMVDDQTFLSGGDSGSICLWSITKKKPIFTLQLAHGVNEYASESEGVIGTARWITSLACLPYGDVFASGSWDGQVRLWKIDPSLRSFSAIATIPALGFVNSLQLLATTTAPPTSKKGDKGTKVVVVVAGVGKEPRMGRWMKIKEGKDGAVVAVLPHA